MKKIIIGVIIISISGLLGLYVCEKILKKINSNQSKQRFEKLKQAHPELPINEKKDILMIRPPVESHKLRYYWDCYAGFRYLPNQKVLNKTINKYGFHDTRDWPEKKPAGEYRIFMFGGSVADGNADSYTIAVFLERALKKINKNIKVYNCGITGMMTTQERILFFNEIINYDPDMIIFLDGVNEFLPIKYGLKPGEHFYYVSAQYDFLTGQKLGQIFNHLKNKLKFMLIDKFLIGRMFFTALNKGPLFSGKDVTENQIKQSIDFYLKNIDYIKTIADKKNIKYLFFIQPQIHYKDNLSLDELFIVKSIAPQTNKFYTDTFDMLLKKTKNNKDIVSLVDIFDSIKHQVFVDYCHFLPIGKKIVAENMKNAIKKMGTVPIS